MSIRKLIILILFSVSVLVLYRIGQSWKAFFHNSNKSIQNILMTKNVLYLSLHEGTIDELKYALEKIKINLTIINLFYNQQFDIYQRHGNKISGSIADKYIKSGKVKEFCDKYDLIIIGDTIPMGRPFYQASKICKKTKIALQVTNRFDYSIVNSPDYVRLMQSLASNHNIYWLPNNDFEMFYLNHYEIYPEIRRTFVIKPYGVCFMNKLAVSLKKTIIYCHSYQRNFLNNVLENSNLSNSKYKLYSRSEYGGPLTLREHNLFIYFPYQISTMKVFQNLNYQVLTAIPTARFFKEIVNKQKSLFEFHEQIHWFINKFSNWTYYFDVYNPKYTDLYLKFDNWDEFYSLINNDINNVSREKYLNEIKQAISLHHSETDMKWKIFLNEVF